LIIDEHSIMRDLNQYLFLKLTLHRTNYLSGNDVNVSWKINCAANKFKLGESYLPDTIIVNPSKESIIVSTVKRSYSMSEKSVLFIAENEKFVISNKNNGDILIMFLGRYSLKKYYEAYLESSAEFYSEHKTDFQVMPVNRLIRNENIMNSSASYFLNNFNIYRHDKLYEDQLEELFLSRVLSINCDEKKLMNGLNFRKKSTMLEVYRRIVNSVEYMHDCYDENISLDELSRQANISKYHYVRLFKNIYGATPNTYFARIKISKAKEFIKNTDSPLTEISHSLGFENLSHFSMKFKKFTGLKPTDFRAGRKKSNII
jgi:AraC-like DNA-binding protein